MIAFLMRIIRWWRRKTGAPLLIYVAGPITKGDILANVEAAIDAGNELLNAGYAPYVPHLSYYWNERRPQGYERWLWLDFIIIAVCDALVRLPGESTGADREVSHAGRLGIPVFNGVRELIERQAHRRA